MALGERRWYEFGDYRLDPVTGMVSKSGRVVSLRPKTAETLRVLVESAGDLVPKEDLLLKVWPGSFVEEAGLARNISELRTKLGRLNGEDYIETVPKRGYRMAIRVRVVQDAANCNSAKLMVVPFALLHGTLKLTSLNGFHDCLMAHLNSIRELSVCEVRGDQDPEIVPEGYGGPGRYILSGTVIEVEGQLEISVRLVSADSGKTVWAETFQEKVDDPQHAKESVCEEIAGALALKFGNQEHKLLSRRYVQNSDAYQAYLRGRFHWNRRSAEGLRTAIKHFERAIDRDPDYAPAFSGLADCYAMLPMVSAAAPRKYMPKAKSAALNALDIDEGLAEARSSLAFVKWHYDWNWAAAERDFKRILRFHPERAISHLSYALLLVEQGRCSEALEEAHRAVRLDPDSASIGANLAMVLHLARRDREAIAAARSVLERDSRSARACWALGLALQHLGQMEEARHEFESMLARFGEMPSALGSLGFLYGVTGQRNRALQLLGRLNRAEHGCPYDRALIYAGIDDIENSFLSLEEAYEHRSFHLVMLKVDRRMDRLRLHPGFAGLLQKIRLT